MRPLRLAEAEPSWRGAIAEVEGLRGGAAAVDEDADITQDTVRIFRIFTPI